MFFPARLCKAAGYSRGGFMVMDIAIFAGDLYDNNLLLVLFRDFL